MKKQLFDKKEASAKPNVPVGGKLFIMMAIISKKPLEEKAADTMGKGTKKETKASEKKKRRKSVLEQAETSLVFTPFASGFC